MGDPDVQGPFAITLEDHARGANARKVRVEILPEGMQHGGTCDGICIKPDGYSTGECDAGIMYLEVHEGRLRLLVWSDIEVFDITHDIDLEKAREQSDATKGAPGNPQSGLSAGDEGLHDSSRLAGKRALSPGRRAARNSDAGKHLPNAVRRRRMPVLLKSPRWTFLTKIPHSHSWFRDENSGWIAVCDDSGPQPDQTEDGVLWLDKSRPVVYNSIHRHYHGATGLSTPLVWPDGRETTTLSNYAEVEYLMREHGMQLVATTSPKSGLDPTVPMELCELRAALRR